MGFDNGGRNKNNGKEWQMGVSEPSIRKISYWSEVGL